MRKVFELLGIVMESLVCLMFAAMLFIPVIGVIGAVIVSAVFSIEVQWRYRLSDRETGGVLLVALIVTLIPQLITFFVIGA